MASFNKLPSGKWRAQVRLRGQHISRSFRLKSEAGAWAREAEIAAASGKSTKAARMSEKTAFGTLIDLHIDDMREVGKAPRRSKRKSLEKLKRDLGSVMLRDLDRERLIAFGKSRAKGGAGPMTIGMDLGYVRTILVHATAIHGIVTPTVDRCELMPRCGYPTAHINASTSEGQLGSQVHAITGIDGANASPKGGQNWTPMRGHYCEPFDIHGAALPCGGAVHR
jgi:hypothetical protein